MARTYVFTETEVALLHRMVDQALQTQKNWICTAVEGENYGRARLLAADLEPLRELFKRTNVEAHRAIDTEAK